MFKKLLLVLPVCWLLALSDQKSILAGEICGTRKLTTCTDCTDSPPANETCECQRAGTSSTCECNNAWDWTRCLQDYFDYDPSTAFIIASGPDWPCKETWRCSPTQGFSEDKCGNWNGSECVAVWPSQSCEWQFKFTWAWSQSTYVHDGLCEAAEE